MTIFVVVVGMTRTGDPIIYVHSFPITILPGGRGGGGGMGL